MGYNKDELEKLSRIARGQGDFENDPPPPIEITPTIRPRSKQAEVSTVTIVVPPGFFSNPIPIGANEYWIFIKSLNRQNTITMLVNGTPVEILGGAPFLNEGDNFYIAGPAEITFTDSNLGTGASLEVLIARDFKMLLSQKPHVFFRQFDSVTGIETDYIARATDSGRLLTADIRTTPGEKQEIGIEHFGAGSVLIPNAIPVVANRKIRFTEYILSASGSTYTQVFFSVGGVNFWGDHQQGAGSKAHQFFLPKMTFDAVTPVVATIVQAGALSQWYLRVRGWYNRLENI